MGRRQAALLAALVLAVLGASAACGADQPGHALTTPAATSSTQPPTPTAPQTIVVTPIPLPAGIHLSFIQQRIDEGGRRAQVRVVNGTPHALHVRSVGIDWAGYPLRHLARADYDVPGQSTIDLFYTLPAAVCTRAAFHAPMYAVALTGTARIRKPVQADGRRFLRRLWTTECNTRRLEAAVHVAYGDTFTEQRVHGRLVLHGSLELDRRRGDRDVRVSQVEGSVLFELATPGATDLAPSRTHATVPLDVTDGGRCDPHSRGQSTQTFVFRVWLRLDGGPQIARILEPTRSQQARLLRFLDHACAGFS